MSDGHVYVPPPEFDPRDTEALRRMAEQNHQNAQTQSRLIGGVIGLAWLVVSWPVRRIVASMRRSERSEG